MTEIIVRFAANPRTSYEASITVDIADRDQTKKRLRDITGAIDLLMEVWGELGAEQVAEQVAKLTPEQIAALTPEQRVAFGLEPAAANGAVVPDTQDVRRFGR